MLNSDNQKSEIKVGQLGTEVTVFGAAVTITPEGVSTQTTGESTVKFQRTLLNQDGAFFDEESSKYVSLDEALQAFLQEAPDVISEIEKLMGRARTPKENDGPL